MPTKKGGHRPTSSVAPPGPFPLGGCGPRFSCCQRALCPRSPPGWKAPLPWPWARPGEPGAAWLPWGRGCFKCKEEVISGLGFLAGLGCFYFRDCVRGVFSRRRRQASSVWAQRGLCSSLGCPSRAGGHSSFGLKPPMRAALSLCWGRGDVALIWQCRLKVLFSCVYI